MLIYNNEHAKCDAPVVLYLHGGGFLGGRPEVPSHFLQIAQHVGATLVSVDYRLATQTCFPGPQEDCYEALSWVVENPARLGSDPTRVSLMGESAGGGLAAATALMNRDRDQHQIKSQILIYPMLDCRTGTEFAPVSNAYTGEMVWTREFNKMGWNALRGPADVEPEPAEYFSPSAASDLSNLPPTFIAVGTRDLFLEEDVDYALKLARSGVSVECVIYPDGVHGFDHFQPELSTKFKNDLRQACVRLL